MLFLRTSNDYGRNCHLVELTEEEVKLPADTLINMADNHGVNITGTHFGGNIECLDKDMRHYYITVYID